MLNLMARAFLFAGFTDLRTDLANGAGKLAAAGHVCRSETADFCAINIEGDATRHVLHVLFA
jgi:hypothetical protein